jgi:hypothetical protein
MDDPSPNTSRVQEVETAVAAGSGAQHVFSCARRASRSPVPSQETVLSPVVRTVPQAIRRIVNPGFSEFA